MRSQDRALHHSVSRGKNGTSNRSWRIPGRCLCLRVRSRHRPWSHQWRRRTSSAGYRYLGRWSATSPGSVRRDLGRRLPRKQPVVHVSHFNASRLRRRLNFGGYLLTFISNDFRPPLGLGPLNSDDNSLDNCLPVSHFCVMQGTKL